MGILIELVNGSSPGLSPGCCVKSHIPHATLEQAHDCVPPPCYLTAPRGGFIHALGFLDACVPRPQMPRWKAVLSSLSLFHRRERLRSREHFLVCRAGTELKADCAPRSAPEPTGAEAACPLPECLRMASETDLVPILLGL